jgi:hypothetical protein
MKGSILYALTVSLLGYAILALSAVAITLLTGLATGYHPSLTFFTMALLTFRTYEIHRALVLFPPLAAASAVILLSKTPLNRRIAAGLGLSSPYLLIALAYLLRGAGEFPQEIAIAWVAWVFVVGVASSAVVERLRVAKS